ncbi:hypothetical protein DEO72_LG3g1618 [Vigna unguiculata]|uniref:Uncharacterized protein n=1 Tax=Vigna unguiculata TaxID=3917 RepID=A0A4D6LEU4_VIGUN|nr:hypothetical protein DEO72_LG3g1618 [Vigna unguiculata]
MDLAGVAPVPATTECAAHTNHHRASIFSPPSSLHLARRHQPPPSRNLLRELFHNTTASQLTPPSLPQLTSPATTASSCSTIFSPL